VLLVIHPLPSASSLLVYYAPLFDAVKNVDRVNATLDLDSLHAPLYETRKRMLIRELKKGREKEIGGRALRRMKREGG
tara:strand:+ start:184 stop:417 length:234 start_codon:yes stop_codon:yes gene_type:complete